MMLSNLHPLLLLLMTKNHPKQIKNKKETKTTSKRIIKTIVMTYLAKILLLEKKQNHVAAASPS